MNIKATKTETNNESKIEFTIENCSASDAICVIEALFQTSDESEEIQMIH